MTDSDPPIARPEADQPRLADLLTFWFDPASRPYWFDSTPAFDAQLRERFLDLYAAAADGGLRQWRTSAHGCLGLVLLLDQVPRNVFRGTPQAFATDPEARAITLEALDKAFDRELDEAQRLFLYLPLEHSEDLADQDRSVALIAQLTSEPAWKDYADKHRAVIARFGRFPHRNALLGRESTAEEREFLEQGVGW
ncbi:DUF924 family protein [Rhodovibrio salinarum]|uniref:DUF924 domain-containing protein n=1 Tax=Rhodovibrio salinarum TaxID=1087 RepID=A0A934UZ91_9PROT|nr:DUF924 family protein [Rhodovibrio salinarum]MBK1696266.1 DUF924 domain-containing protein [Rhodovibrio salinarum]